MSRKCKLFVERLYGRDGANVSRDPIKTIKAKVTAEGAGARSTGGLCGSGRFRSIERGQGMM